MDAKKYVKPIATNFPPQPAKSTEVKGIFSADKFVTLTKYSYYESGKWSVKALIDLKGVQSHPKDKISVEFKKRSFTLKILDLKGQNYQFTVPKLQCYIEPEKCSWVAKSDTIQITLRKAKEDDNWWSLFKSKAVGEVESD